MPFATRPHYDYDYECDWVREYVHRRLHLLRSNYRLNGYCRFTFSASFIFLFSLNGFGCTTPFLQFPSKQKHVMETFDFFFSFWLINRTYKYILKYLRMGLYYIVRYNKVHSNRMTKLDISLHLNILDWLVQHNPLTSTTLKSSLNFVKSC